MDGSTRGHRLFKAGSLGLIVFGAVHSLAVINAFFGEPATEKMAEIVRLLKDTRARFGPLEASAFGTTQLLNASFSLLMLQLGVVNLVAFRPVATSGRLRRLAAVNMGFALALLLMTAASQFPPPLVFAAAVFGLFLAAWLRIPRSAAP